MLCVSIVNEDWLSVFAPRSVLRCKMNLNLVAAIEVDAKCCYCSVAITGGAREDYGVQKQEDDVGFSTAEEQ